MFNLMFNIWHSALRDRKEAEISTLKSLGSHFGCPQLPGDGLKCKARVERNKISCFAFIKQNVSKTLVFWLKGT